MSEIETEQGVLIGTADNFNEIVTGNEDVLVHFYAPWAGHCQTLHPEYAKAATKLLDEGSRIKLVKIDATVAMDLATECGVKGFPTLIHFKNGRFRMYYSGGRTEAEIIAWMKKNPGPSTTPLDTSEDVRAFIERRNIAVVGFFADRESDAARVFIELAESMDDVDFGICASSEAEFYGVAQNAVTVFNKARAAPCTAEPGLDKEALRAFVQTKMTALITEFSDDIASKIFEGSNKNFLLLFLSKQAEDAEGLIAALRDAAETLDGRVMAIIINTDLDDNDRVIEYFKLRKEDAPAVRLINLNGDMTKYIMDAPYTAERYRAFVAAWEAGEVAPSWMSGEIPETQDGPVYQVVGKSFDDVVRNSGKNVFVHFYAPWSGSCRELAPIWESLAERYAESDSVRIAKMDSTSNEAAGVRIDSFPTLKYFLASGEVIDYSGERTLDDFIHFIDSGGADQTTTD